MSDHVGEKTGKKVVGWDGDMVEEVRISGVVHISVSTTVPIDYPIRRMRDELGHKADGGVLEVDLDGVDY